MFVKCRISTLHTSKSAANFRGQGLEFTAVPLTGIACKNQLAYKSIITPME